MAKLTDMYAEDEIPTRPDWPSTVARRCRHCGKVYGEHTQIVRRPVPRASCRELRKHFDPEGTSNGDKQR